MHRQIPFLSRLASLILIVLFLLTPAYAAQSTDQFTDLPADTWYTQAAQFVWAQGWMTGTSETTFSPDTVMTRGMLVTVLYRMAGSPSLEDELLGYPYADVPGDTWYADGVYWARLTEIAGGYGENFFGPNDPVTREQFVTILWRWSGCPEGEVSSGFDDESSLSSWAAEAVDWASSCGVVSGKPGNIFDPDGQATRAEAAVILTRYYQQNVSEEPEPSPEPSPEPEPSPTPEPEQPEPEDPGLEEPEQPVSVLLPNTYDSSAFVVENGFLTYQGDAPSYIGVDVSSHQNEVDWEQVAAAGVDFAMIRVGYRGYTEGGIYQDHYWEENITGALDAGLSVGVYFFSQATSVEEAREEALQTLIWIADYDITYPVVFDWERVSGPHSRTSSTTGDMITACAQAFCQLVEEAGYTAMTYGSPSKVGSDLDLAQLTDYPFWLAHYTTDWNPTSFPYHYDMWQYTSSGSVDGIEGRVDLSLCLTEW